MKEIFHSTKSGAGGQSLMLDCRAQARTKGMFFHRHRYVTFIGWANNHFNKQHFRNSLETEKNTRNGNRMISLLFSQRLKRRLLKR